MDYDVSSLIHKRSSMAKSLFSDPYFLLPNQLDDAQAKRTKLLYEREYEPFIDSKEFIDAPRRLKMLGEIGVFPLNIQKKSEEEIKPQLTNQCEVLAKVVETHMPSALKKKKIIPKSHPQWKLMRVISGYYINTGIKVG